ncbi:MAG: hypothetical protein EXR76_02685 [Myxococcales bacterium]|nr:hypothetical protein [Myxococcales bacterium]
MSTMSVLLVLLSLALVPLPSDSIYHLKVNLLDHEGHARSLSDTRGKPVVIAMFYASCKSVCPLLINDVKRLLTLVEVLSPQAAAET